MKKMPKNLPLLLLFIVFFVTGCASVSPDSLGLPQSQWDQYSPEKRAQLSSAYKQTQIVKQTQPVRSGSSILQVNIEGGRVLMPPYSSLQAYQPMTFQIKEGECHLKVPAPSKLNPKQKTLMTACYSDHILYLDASPYEADKAYGSVLLRFMPLWRRGFTYPGVNTTGLAKLENGNITIKEVSS